MALVFLLCTVSGIGIAAFVEEDGPVYNALEKIFYLTAEDAVWTRPGLNVVITGVTIPADRKPVFSFRISDSQGVALDREGKFTPGAVSMNFLFAYIPKNADQYVSYYTRTQTSPITKVTAIQAGTASGGTYVSLGDGNYTYTPPTAIPADYDQTATHTLGIYATRNLREYGLSFYVSNVTKDFVPNGSPVTKIRDVVRTAACNGCHDPLALHGETGRRNVEICVLCHTPQTIDPDTGNTVDMPVMTHKIHMGSRLPSVVAGKHYVIIGNAGSVHDYSDITLPQDIRNCEVCHKDSTQVAQWFTHPTRVNCGSCHDAINFATGLNHPGGAQPNDKFCGYCHWEKGDWEYDATIRGAHTVPYKSLQLRNPKVEIVSVSNLGPGLKPSVKFKLSDRLGSVVKPSDLNRLTFRFAGPTGDYRWNFSEAGLTATTGADGVSTYNFATGIIPADATGSVALEVEGYFSATLNKGTLKEVAQRDVIDNVLKFYALPGATLTARRTIVDDAKCDKCHDKLWFHGGNRNNAQVCGVCHNPTLTDSRPADKGGKESLDQKIMIHKIHTGKELKNDYSILGSSGTGVSFNDIGYPGDRRNCLACHATGTYTVPLPASATPVTWPHNAWSPVLPTAASCLGCHDSIEAAIHALTNTAPFGESCKVCHQETADASVSKVHAR